MSISLNSVLFFLLRMHSCTKISFCIKLSSKLIEITYFKDIDKLCRVSVLKENLQRRSLYYQERVKEIKKYIFIISTSKLSTSEYFISEHSII